MSSLEAARAATAMQEYIEERMTEPITLRELADTAGYSPWHAARLFKEATGLSPFDYIRARRLTKAALALRDGGDRILDVALDFVFGSHEGFTRAFSKAFGISPKKYSLQTPPIKLFMPNRAIETFRYYFKEEKQMSDTAVKAIFVQVIERPARKCLLLRGKTAEDYFEYCEEVGCDVWSVLTSVKEALYEPIGMWLPKALVTPGTSLYVQGVEVPQDYSNLVPDGYELVDLPPCTMMVFQGEPYDDEAFEQAIGEVWEHVKKFDPRLYGYDWAPEAAPRFQLAPMGYRGYIEAYPVKELN
ncbi:AraC-type DNA-binding protein [Sporobacter termitidis DSM 10068]|uniref:AraC-type DNA-binding protein n=1 Tax=Sporobacter termitidis DSM 10068 TaxID=1123282 RepID=A0A1M5YW72_9FIRM|nr:AraC family transcriptional regulator [Sporobacter termitidis]SHI16138.1 AraC-type DNA-binding protein [Sporobacter termitidis DSM 10068]